jgi:hypothetical protein
VSDAGSTVEASADESPDLHSASIRKYKEWQDAEYVVKRIDCNMQRLSVNGVFTERRALACAWIEHKGECYFMA